ncbi:MAG: SDR family NAD(P)-dependent oxidoreductase [Firmicutes bacterium]|nr:SDR family NAD(P)-dependent oxidoreductase [Bacillota bacterium]
MKKMEELLCKLLWGQLQSIGMFTNKNFTTTDLKVKSRQLYLFDRWLTESLRILSERNYLSFDGNAYTCLNKGSLNIDETWKEWEREKVSWLKDLKTKAQVILIETTMRALPDILTGKVLATDIMFPKSSMELVEGIYKNNPIADYFNEVLGETIVAYIEERLRRDSSSRIRLIEIGSGTGGTSVKVFQKISKFRPYIQEYCYTDISKAFLMYAEKEYGPANPYLNYKVFNVEAPVAGQGISPGSYDIAIATNVLHATKNICKTLRNVKAVLRKNGLILLNEISNNSLFTHLTFGLLEGWWLYEDPDLRIPGCPGLFPETWKEVLEREGFQSVFFPAQESHNLGHQIIAAQSNGVIRQVQEPLHSFTPVKQSGRANRSYQVQKLSQFSEMKPSQKEKTSQTRIGVTERMVEDYIKERVIEKLSESLKVDVGTIDVTESFADYGVDSIIGVKLIDAINQTLEIDLQTTDLFDNSSVNKLTKYILTKHKETIAKILNPNIEPAKTQYSISNTNQKQPVFSYSNRYRSRGKLPQIHNYKKDETESIISKEPIAIIGMSGRFAKSKTIHELWEHLANGTDLVEKVSRWDLSKYYSENESYCNYGSFLDDIDLFDPLFFNISGLEATYMDPQQRIFLEESWKALEDAGYAGEKIGGSQYGVYVGCCTGDYQMLLGDNPPPQALWSSCLSSVIPARIAYYLDLHGPAVTIDTACSSSLVSIHVACQSLWAGEIEMALAGGVYIHTTPQYYLYANRAGMLSLTGRCHTFDDRADGMVPGEAVGVVVLKRLKEAVADGDHIYGVIRGIGINQDGTTNGITAPSLNSQERLECHVYDTFQINPEHIQMVEAHGTGTKLGDPIEFQALSRAFRKYTDKQEYCAIGSIKTNIGHAQLASGITGVIKVLLSLQHKQIPPSLHFQSGNSNIQFKNSPFFVNTTLRDWETEPGIKRCAAVSSFGASGTNAHLVIEEAPPMERHHEEKPGYLIVLSARTSNQLRQQVLQLVEYCERESQDSGNMSFTLLLGRKHFNHRLACVIRDQNELLTLLKKWLDNGKVSQVFVSELRDNDFQELPSLKVYGNQCIENCQKTINASEYLEHLSTIANLYVQGYSLEFEQLFISGEYSRISLPTYPFARERYWVSEKDSKSNGGRTLTSSDVHPVIHPLVHRNISDFAEQRFCSIFTGREFFLMDHVVKKQKILPGVAHLEMARTAASLAAGNLGDDLTGIKLKNVVWARPIVVTDEPVRIDIGLLLEDNGEIAYEIFSEPQDGGKERILHSQGIAVIRPGSKRSMLDLTELKTQCNQEVITAGQCYEAYRAMGIEYGPAHQGVKQIYMGQAQLLAKLSLPSSAVDTLEQYILHPSLMDSALQASIGLMMGYDDLTQHNNSASCKPFLPFALGEIEVFNRCTSSMWVWIRFSDDNKTSDKVQKLDFDLTDESGAICIRMKGFASRMLEGEVSSQDTLGTLMLHPYWKEQSVAADKTRPVYARHLVILCELSGCSETKIEAQLNGVAPEFRCLVLQLGREEIDKRFQTYALRIFKEISNIIHEKLTGTTLIQLVIPLWQEQELFSGLLGILKTAQLENSKLIGQLIEVEPETDAIKLADWLKENSYRPMDNRIRYQDGKRWITSWNEIDISKADIGTPWKDQGIYLITGGAGGLGLIFAREIARRVKNPTLILTGRSPLSKDKQVQLKELETSGAHIVYKQVDATDKRAVESLIQSIIKDFGNLHGVIHSAGVIKDNLISKKTEEEFLEVLGPKVTGVVNLDEATKNLPLDFCIFFSSGAGTMGNIGQADYSAANAFMDAYAKYRNTLVESKQRFGQTLSINWPLWEKGGMHVEEETEKLMSQTMGMVAMKTSTGIGALYQCIASGQAQVMVLEGKVARMRQKLFAAAIPASTEPKAQAISVACASTIFDKAREVVRQIISQLLKVKIEDIDVNVELSEYGFDSIMLTEFANKINQEFRLELAPTIFFEHSTIYSFAEYLVAEHAAILAAQIGEPAEIGNVSKDKQPESPITPLPASYNNPVIDSEGLADKIQVSILKILSKLLKVNIDEIDVFTELNEYGFDSIMLTEFANNINQEFHLELTPTIFFEHSTVHSFTEYLLADHRMRLAGHFEMPVKAGTAVKLITEPVEISLPTKSQRNRFAQTVAMPLANTDQKVQEPIAIIGMSFNFPQASNEKKFWENLIEGKDCISEIPIQRWDWREYYGDPTKEANKTNIKWGGFIDGVDEFDPLFFGISPREAEYMDPQQRLLMTHVWKAIEDAGYSPGSLWGTKTAIFVGTSSSGYNGLITRANMTFEGSFATGAVPSVGPSRMSYFLNLHGPSEPIETACSSSLVAIHRAVAAIENGTCEMAIVGGVNTIISPELHISFSKAGMLSEDGRCKTFSNQANGYVRGEGVGMLFLKKLKDAERAGDHIYGVIRGVAENHGGRANSLTAPNPKAQAELLVTAYSKAGIDPRTVGYIETHGTGTELGDPIEINGLKAAFKELYQLTGDPQVHEAHCGLGSVKTNIGHLEMAAGVAGVIKVLLQIKHKTLVKSLHCDTINPYIQLDDSPFYIIKENMEWKPFVDSQGRVLPRRAGVSSFGFGGVNAHVVIEEYIPRNIEQNEIVTPQNPAIFILSARNEECLKEQARQLVDAIEEQNFSDANLADIAYTLQVGREGMEERLGLIARSLEELKQKLKLFLEGHDGIRDLYRGHVKRNKETFTALSGDEDMAKTLDAWLTKKKYAKLLDLWVKGLTLDWTKLYGETMPRRLSLPTYPFTKEHYWIDLKDRKATNLKATTAVHPLLHYNTSTLSEYRFSSIFEGEEFFLADYVVKGQRILPEVVFLEMAREAVIQALGISEESHTFIRLKNVVWDRPIVVTDQPVRVHILLIPEAGGEIAYEVYSGSEQGETGIIIHNQGRAILGSDSVADFLHLDFDDIKAHCNQNIPLNQCNEPFKAMGIEYGPGYQGIQAIYLGEGQVLAKLSLPAAFSNTQNQFILHPSLMNAAFQVALGLMMGAVDGTIPGSFGTSYLRLLSPLRLQDIDIFGKLDSTTWVLIQYRNDPNAGDGKLRIDIDFCNDQGKIYVRMKGIEFCPVGWDTREFAQMPGQNQQQLEAPEDKEAKSLLAVSVEHLTSLIAEVTKIPVNKLDAGAHFEELGLDSIMISLLNQKTEQWVGKMDVTLFFKYSNIQSLGAYIAEAYPEAVASLMNQPAALESARKYPDIQFSREVPGLISIRSAKSSLRFGNSSQFNINGHKDIAIIGVAGRYPLAETLEQFWQNLYEGKDCIREIPPQRWSLDGFFEPERAKAVEKGLSYSKWGGFLDNIDCFDPLFFNISPRDAYYMDPQERLFLEVAWECLEDAGYTRESLKQEGYGNQIGVFVGATFNNYQLIMAEAALKANCTMYVANSQTFSIANRVSFIMNFTGPSLVVDTACSSSLYAIHLACESICSGQSRMAIAGGVNLSLHPSKYITLSAGQFGSSDGRCRAFCEGGTGYVPSEAVGAVFLKPLQDAIADGDYIYGVIKGTAATHDGKTNGYNVPSPVSQSCAIEKALQQSQIDPRSISCIEAHGTGTVLGDPIEITGLVDVFRKYTKDTGFCSISSVKSNIGHAEAAAGIAQLTKVLLQFKHQTLVKNVMHGNGKNPNIDFVQTPFVLQENTTAWNRPLINGREVPRRAGISSFGAGGANAHIVIEEYLPPYEKRQENMNKLQNPVIIVLSAKNKERLREKAWQLIATIRKRGFHETDLVDVAYTLQVGREAMEERLAMIVSSLQELERKLTDFVELKDDVPNLYRGQAKRDKESLVPEDLEKIVDGWVLHQDVKLLELWVKGLNVDWNKLYGEFIPRRISLPTYPFAKEKYWITDIIPNNDGGSKTTSYSAVMFIHPLLQQNTSDFSVQRYTSTFTGREFFLTNRLIQGKQVFPEATYFEIAQTAILHATGNFKEDGRRVRLKDVVWGQAVVGNYPLMIHIRLFPENDDTVSFEIYRESDVEPGDEIYCQGVAMLNSVETIPTLDLKAIQDQCNQHQVTSAECYQTFNAVGFEYGTEHQGIEVIYVGKNLAMAKLSLPASLSATPSQFVLHPGILEAGLQAALYLSLNDSMLGPSFPVALQELEIFEKCMPVMWAVFKFHNDFKNVFDLMLCDESGKVCVKIIGMSLKKTDDEMGLNSSMTDLEAIMLYPVWKDQAITQELPGKYLRHLIFLCEPGKTSLESIEAQIDGIGFSKQCFLLHSQEEGIENRFQTYAIQIFEEIQRIFRDRPQGKVLLQVVVSALGERELFSGISGILKTAQRENPKFIGQLIEVAPDESTESIGKILKENSQSPSDKHIRYQYGKRWVLYYNELKINHEELNIPWRDRGVYLITGGTGGLGLIFSREIVQQAKEVTLVLTGRSQLTEDKVAQLKKLQMAGANVLYEQVDVGKKKEVDELIRKIQGQFGVLHGIIHCAGVIRDNFILKKTKEEMQEVLTPKVSGLVNLDQASKDLQLDFFICFSSGAGVMGNVGQADYSTANAFLDAYAHYRNNLVAINERSGRTLTINWPLWREGGMRVDNETEKVIKQHMGLIPMQTATGIRALYQGLASCESQVMVMEGELGRMRKVLFGIPAESNSSSCEELLLNINQTILQEKVISQLKALFGEVSKMAVHRIDADEPLETYGIDSVMITQLNQKLADVFGELSQTLFYEYQNLGDIAKYLVTDFPRKCAQWSGLATSSPSIPAKHTTDSSVTDQYPRLTSIKLGKKRVLNSGISGFGSGTKEPVAIIGITGRYPQARNLKEFWENLKTGKDCITDIPKERWPLEGFYHPNPQEAVAEGKSYSKWGGFIDGFAEFDPLFFNIAPREALNMDPQERLFIEACWNVLEDAGYTREQLASKFNRKIGVFAGITKTGFDLYGPDLWRKGKKIFPYTSFSSVANRVSYLLNLKGPSMPVDTMCSSSLTAIHEACEHLHRGECEMAIAGGVNLYLHPSTYVGLCAQQMLSVDGKCKSFGKGGNGFVPGEGVGCVLLKPLSKAIADQDHIYAIIRATNINHGGKTNGYTVPNPMAQAELIRTALDKAGLSSRAVSYIEAHGTGTELGDPIEITGLNQAFEKDTQDTGFCVIGSVKSNIGHLEAAAGIAGLTKVVLQLQNQLIVPSLHAEETNPYIHFSKTPFTLSQELTEWKRPLIKIDGMIKEFPRIAGISSFGAGGANAHVIIEEYVPQDLKQVQISVGLQNPVIIVLSARNEESLKKQAHQLLAWTQEREYSGVNLADVAYTLQVGREAMEERLALIVTSMAELAQKLKNFIQGQDQDNDLYRGQVKKNKETLAILAADEEMQETIKKWIQRGKWSKLLDLWVRGLNIDWNTLYGDIRPHRISLPTYPFMNECYWVSEIDNKVNNMATELANYSINNNVQTKVVDPSGPKLSLQSSNPNDSRDEKATKFQQILMGKSPLTPADNRSEAAACGERSSISKHSLRSLNQAGRFVSHILEKPSGILLRTVSEGVVFSRKLTRPNPIQSLMELSSPLTQPENTGEIKPKSYVQQVQSGERLQEELARSLAEVLSMKPGDIDPDAKLIDVGLDSIIGVEWIQQINNQYGTSISTNKIYDFPSIRQFSVFLAQELGKQGKRSNQMSSISNQLAPQINLQQSGPVEPEYIRVIPEPKLFKPESNEDQQLNSSSLKEELIASLAEVLTMQPSEIEEDAKFIDLGLDSIIGVEWVKALNLRFGTSIATSKVYDYPTIQDFTGYLIHELKKVGGLDQTIPNPRPSLSLQQLLQQVHQGVMDIEQADQILNQIIMEEKK